MRKIIILFIAIFAVISVNIGVFCQSAVETEAVYAESVTTEAVTADVRPEKEEQAVFTADEIDYFSDLPSGHWAKDAVNELVKSGLTHGYPDGSFRGPKYITRYETAIFLSKMSHKSLIKNSINEKLLEELKAEVYKIRYNMDLYKREPFKGGPVTGRFTSRARFGNLISGNAAYPGVVAPIGPVFDYRLITSYRQEFDRGTYIKLTIDTMDSGFSTPRDFVRELFDFEGGVTTPSHWGVKLTSGPGTVIHDETSNIFPSEDNVAYLRPENGGEVNYKNGSFDAGVKYSTTGTNTYGVTSSHNLGFYLGRKFSKTPAGDVELRYSADQFVDDLRRDVATLESTINLFEITVKPDGKNEYGIKLGTSSHIDPTNYCIGGYFTSRSIFGGGSLLRLEISRIGSEFMDYPFSLNQGDILGANMFDKLYKNGTYDLGIELAQAITASRAFRIKGGLVLGENGAYDASVADAEATIEINVDYGMSGDAVMTLGYKIYQKPSLTSNTTSDILGIGFRYSY